MSKYLISKIFSLNASIENDFFHWSKEVSNGVNHRLKLSSLFLKFRSMEGDFNCDKEDIDDGKIYEISIVRHKTDEEMYVSLNGYNEIGHQRSYYVILYQYLKGYVTIEASIRFDNERVSYINYTYDSPTSRESFSYKKGKYIGT